MTTADVFDLLLGDRQVKLEMTKDHANILRVALSRKFSNYKSQMDSVGFLDPDLEAASLSLEYDKESNIAAFYLRPKKRSTVQFKIITDVTETHDS